MPLNPCEACHSAPIECRIDSDEPEQPYLLCEQCAHRLLMFSLRPLEWFRLAAIHGPSQFYLHDDFYFFNGIAQVPREEVLFPELFPAPTLEEAAEDLETLIDYAMTGHHLAFEENTLDVLRNQNKLALLESLRERIASTHAVEIEAQAYEICASVLEREAEEWIRSRWDVYRPGAFYSLTAASATCLPFPEGFQRVIHELDTMTPREVRFSCSALAYFCAEKTLDWLEIHVSAPVTETWGRLAAVSQLSWVRVTKWLDQGRPLSLVALDALYACGHYDTPLLRKLAPKLLEPDTRERMTARLERYAAQDPVPRVQQKVAAITNQWDAILS
jgi:hypothetical protein